MKCKNLLLLGSLVFSVSSLSAQGITPVPNQDFESWNSYSGYSDPEFWDSPNEEISAIPFFGTTVVSKSTDHQSGSYSARLESKEILMIGEIPGFLTCGQLTIDISTLSFEVTGGAPVFDMPTHLKGYYKYLPKGGDSCAIGIGLFKTIIDTVAGNTTTEVGVGYFSTRDTVSDWTLFSAWIDYYVAEQPDTMNIIALSSAQEDMTPGTVLFLDNLFLDYTVGVDPTDPAAGVSVYHDQETSRLLVFCQFEQPQQTTITLYTIVGTPLVRLPSEWISTGKQIVACDHLPKGIYILEVIHDGKRYVVKYLLN